MASLDAGVDLSYLLTALAADADVRDAIRDQTRVLEQAQRSCIAVLNRAHSCTSQQVPEILQQLVPLLPAVNSSLAGLAQLVPPTQFYRYQPMFSNALQQASFIIVLSTFLQTEGQQVATKQDVANSLGIDEAWRERFFLPTEEYLHSLISLLNELSRLAINRVTLGDYASPVLFSRFSKELSTAFGLLNLKNDSLRKRFDGIKYDVKKLEEIVYDLSLRGLLPTQQQRRPNDPTSAVAPEDASDERGPSKRARQVETVEGQAPAPGQA